MNILKEPDLQNKIESLFIPYEGQSSLLLESYDKVIQYIFEDHPTYKIKINNDNYMILSYADFGIYSMTNHNATTLFRTYTNIYQDSTIYGHALVVGKDQQSVSQQMVDSILNIYYRQ